jgi:hypothetical protein
MHGQLTLGGAPTLMASDGNGGLILVLSVGSVASLSQQRNEGAQPVFTQKKSTPDY